MNKRWVLLVCVIVVALATFWLLRKPAKPSEKPTATVSTILSSIIKSNAPVIANRSLEKNNPSPSRPRLFKSTNYPPQTAEEKAMWDWYHAMHKIDPSFEGKTPIEFYGKIIDQFSNSVEEANVVLAWTTVVGPTPTLEKRMSSGVGGLFSISDIKGKRLAVDVSKEGYLSTSNSSQSFEYSDFTDNLFHVPDANKPVIFRLHKIMEAEPLYLFGPYGKIIVGVPVSIDAATGKIVENGDFIFTVTLGEKRGQFGPDYTITLNAEGGAGFALTDEEFPSLAPENGYMTTFVLEEKASDPDYRLSQNIRFYARTRTGKYAMIGVVISVPSNGNQGSIEAGIRYNPSGSRNLEFDQNKWINR